MKSIAKPKNLLQANQFFHGPVVARSLELNKQLKLNKSSLPFDKLISCNIGNPRAFGQRSLTFVRDVLSLVINPTLKERSTFPTDVVKRSELYLKHMPDLGAYSESQGMLPVREEVCRYLNQRDGSDVAVPDNVYLTNGASEAVRLCMQAVMRSPKLGFNDTILTPIPQYPLYTAIANQMGIDFVSYLLDESAGWACSAEIMSQALSEAQTSGRTARALVVINPGNPTGQVMTLDSMGQIVQWCRQEGVLLMADEVYQDNIWKEGAKFVSFRKVAMEMGAFEEPNPLQLISFHSISKGFMGDCGFRGGYFEMLGVPEQTKTDMARLASVIQCSNTVGQVATGIMSQPPVPGDPSHEQYVRERDEILASLKTRAQKVSLALSKLPGVTCNAIDGAMYAFPSITLPVKAVTAAQELNMAPDSFYCLQLLEETGILVAPGSGFGQRHGTHHFRTTILPPAHQIDEVVDKLTKFHLAFLKKYE